MTRGELLDGVMNNYRRFYMKKALFHYPWRGTGFRRRYLLGCLFAFLKAALGALSTILARLVIGDHRPKTRSISILMKHGRLPKPKWMIGSHLLTKRRKRLSGARLCARK